MYVLSTYFLFIAYFSTNFVRDDNTDSGSIDKVRLRGPDDEISGDSNDSGLHSQDLSKNGTLSSFVWDEATIKQSDTVTFKTELDFLLQMHILTQGNPIVNIHNFNEMAILIIIHDYRE